ncbi:hypothetical protein BJX96DRAFT_147421 [Aspergillus floccosus]
MTYISLPKEDHDLPDAEELPQPRQAPNRWRATSIFAVATISLCLGVAAFVLTDYTLSPKTLSKPQLQFQFHCGSTPAEARAAGCHFDMTTFTWVPPACFDEGLMNELLGLRNWTWHRDAEGKHPVDEAFARSGDYEFLYTSMRYHVMHCVYVMKKLHRSLLSGDVRHIDGYMASTHHTDHCLQMMMSGGDLDGRLAVGYTKFASCGQGVFDDTSQHGWFRVHDGERLYRLPES